MFTKRCNFFRWSNIDYLFFWDALFTSLKVRWWLLFFSYQKVQSKVVINTSSFLNHDDNKKETLQLIRKSLSRVNKIAIWRFKCIEQSFTAALMLKRRNIPFTLYFGVWKHHKQLKAHVWIVSSGEEIVERGNTDFIHIHQIEA